jgi:hypothetical protein
VKNAAEQILVPPGTLLVFIVLSQNLLYLGKAIFVCIPPWYLEYSFRVIVSYLVKQSLKLLGAGPRCS